MKKLFSPVAAVLCLALAGCGPLLHRNNGREPVLLTVQNQRFEDASIYAIWQGGPRRRVGTVTGMTSQTFSFEWVSDEVTFDVDFLASEGYIVDTIDVDPGDHLDLVILNIRP
jgi:hypothetical protein